MVSIRNKGDTVNIWNKLSGNKEEIDSTTNELKQITGFTAKYSAHTKVRNFSKFRTNSDQNFILTNSDIGFSLLVQVLIVRTIFNEVLVLHLLK